VLSNRQPGCTCGHSTAAGQHPSPDLDAADLDTAEL
jgi:hypothetical protein